MDTATTVLLTPEEILPILSLLHITNLLQAKVKGTNKWVVAVEDPLILSTIKELVATISATSPLNMTTTSPLLAEEANP
jgi:molybdenum cofactor biosynthesis enzyme MoaA